MASNSLCMILKCNLGLIRFQLIVRCRCEPLSSVKPVQSGIWVNPAYAKSSFRTDPDKMKNSTWARRHPFIDCFFGPLADVSFAGSNVDSNEFTEEFGLEFRPVFLGINTLAFFGYRLRI